MLIAVINESTMVSNNDCDLMAKAIQIQLNLHVLPAWNVKAGTITFYPDKTKVPGWAWVVSILDNPDVANALGYHDETNDAVDGFIFCQPVLSNGGVVLYDHVHPQNVSVSSVLSHEVCEMVGDRFANGWQDNGNTSYAQELCDPVQGDSYAIVVSGVSVSVSNFIFPSFFNPEAKTPVNMPFDYLKKLTAPFTMSKGGYLIYRTGGPGTEQQVFGETMPAWQVEMKKMEFSRFSQRKK